VCCCALQCVAVLQHFVMLIIAYYYVAVCVLLCA